MKQLAQRTGYQPGAGHPGTDAAKAPGRTDWKSRTLLLSLLASLALPAGAAAQPPPAVSEPNIEIARTWWTPQRGVWTPVGWRDHLHRFIVLYNGTLICPPAGILHKPQIEKYKGQDFQLTFSPSADGTVPPIPVGQPRLYRTDGGHGVQGWREDRETPVLWTEWPLQEGLVLRKEVFAHMKGGGDVTTATEPLYAWVRLSVSHVDPIRAPEKFSFAVLLSKAWNGVGGVAGPDDTAFLDVIPERAPFREHELLSSATLTAGGSGNAGLEVRQGDKVRLLVLPGGDGTVSMAEVTSGSRTYGLRVELPVRKGASTDLLVPMLVGLPEEVTAEKNLGYEGALAESEAYWKRKPATAARISTPEHYINQALARNIQFAEIIAELNPDNGEYSFLSGAYGYDALWSTPTSMVSHMFLDLLGYHDVVERHVRLYKANQGTVKPPGPSYRMHPGYFSTPKTLTALDWLSDHGAILEALSRHALLTGDRKFLDEWMEPILKACDFIKDSAAATDHEGAKGVMPPAIATDSLVPMQAVWNQAWIYKGLVTSVEVLKKAGHPRAEEFSQLADNFRSAFQKAFRERAAREPMWTHPDGTRWPVLPAGLIPSPTYHIFDDAFLLDTGPLVLPWAGLLEASDPLMKSFADYFRVGPPTKLWGPRSSPISRAILTHEISTCEPCYSWNIVNSWKTGDREKFLEGMYALFTGSISNQTYINAEHRHAMYGTLFDAPLMTWCLRQAVLDDQLAAGELHLLRLCPLAWISADQGTVFENMPTVYGPVDLRWRLSEDGRTLNVSFGGRWREKPAAVTLHIPPVPGLEAVVINGERHAAGTSIRLAASSGSAPTR